MTMPMGPELEGLNQPPREDEDMPSSDAILSPDGEVDEDTLYKRRRAVETLYGAHCPLVMESPSEGDWAS